MGIETYKINRLVERMDKRGVGINAYGRLNDFIKSGGKKNKSVRKKHIDSLIKVVDAVSEEAKKELEALKKRLDF